jgi:hypothetical protein
VHEVLGAREPQRLAVAGRLEPDAVGTEVARLLEQRERSDARAVRQSREPAALLRLVARLEQCRGSQRRRDEGRREQAASRLFEQHDQVDPAEAGAPVRLRNRESRPAELGDLLPDVAREALRRLRELAHELERARLVEELARLGAQQLLLLGEAEVHASFSFSGRGRLRTRAYPDR